MESVRVYSWKLWVFWKKGHVSLNVVLQRDAWSVETWEILGYRKQLRLGQKEGGRVEITDGLH